MPPISTPPISTPQLTLAVIGGTGPLGRGLGYRFAKAGHTVLVGSRGAERAETTAAEIRDRGVAGEVAGGTNADYVTRAYSDVLGRAPDPSGKAYWTGKLDGGYDRGSVALQFLNAAEARRRLVDDQFLRFLDRLPTATEQSSWVGQIPTSDGEQRLVAFLAGSASYYGRS